MFKEYGEYKIRYDKERRCDEEYFDPKAVKATPLSWLELQLSIFDHFRKDLQNELKR